MHSFIFVARLQPASACGCPEYTHNRLPPLRMAYWSARICKGFVGRASKEPCFRGAASEVQTTIAQERNSRVLLHTCYPTKPNCERLDIGGQSFRAFDPAASNKTPRLQPGACERDPWTHKDKHFNLQSAEAFRIQLRLLPGDRGWDPRADT